MALAAVAAVTEAPDVLYSLGNLKARLLDITLPSSYTDDGDALAKERFGLDTVVYVAPAIAYLSGAATAVLVTYDIASEKVVVFWGNAGTASILPQVTAGTDLDAYTCRLLAFGY